MLHGTLELTPNGKRQPFHAAAVEDTEVRSSDSRRGRGQDQTGEQGWSLPELSRLQPEMGLTMAPFEPTKEET